MGVTVQVGSDGDSSCAANALRVAFIAVTRTAGLDQDQTAAAWRQYQAGQPASTFEGAWDAIMRALAAAPAVKEDTDG